MVKKEMYPFSVQSSMEFVSSLVAFEARWEPLC